MLEEDVAAADQIDAVVRGAADFRLPCFGPFAGPGGTRPALLTLDAEVNAAQ